jgi:hypothetical protein
MDDLPMIGSSGRTDRRTDRLPAETIFTRSSRDSNHGRPPKEGTDFRPAGRPIVRRRRPPAQPREALLTRARFGRRSNTVESAADASEERADGRPAGRPAASRRSGAAAGLGSDLITALRTRPLRSAAWRIGVGFVGRTINSIG